MSLLDSNCDFLRYSTVAVAGMNLPVCPREAKLSVSTTSGSGHLSNFVGPHRSHIGTEACPWQLSVRPGQKLRLRDVLIPAPAESLPPDNCLDVYVIKVCLSKLLHAKVQFISRSGSAHYLNVGSHDSATARRGDR